MQQTYTQEDKEKFDNLFWNRAFPWEVEWEYIEKTKKYLKFIKWIPWIRLVWIGNSIAMNSATLESDIDLLIVTEKNRMWLVRIMCTFIFQILWVRKNDKHHAGRFCLSFFCTLEWLDFSRFALEKDPYLYFWLLSFKPLLDYNDSYKLFLEKNTSWANLSHFEDIIIENRWYIEYSKDSKHSSTEDFSTLNRDSNNSISTKILHYFDHLCKKLFLPKTLSHYEKIWRPYGVIINNEMLKFHNWDIRKEIAEKF